MGDPHTFYIVTSFAAFALSVVGLTLWVIIDHRAQKSTLAGLEARGMRRRSARAAKGENA
ncbi:MAG TPA: heme exporter protein CcmD [Hyphomicrobiales bacterium]|nr:heme exporter protein CcmD [Hyphomicrobiales bacterium]